MNWPAFGGLLVVVAAVFGLVAYRWVKDGKEP